MSAFDAWRVSGSHFGLLEGLGASFWVLGVSFGGFWGILGGHFWLLGAPFGSLGVTLWSKVAPEDDFAGFWEPFGLHFESFWWLLGII